MTTIDEQYEEAVNLVWQHRKYLGAPSQVREVLRAINFPAHLKLAEAAEVVGACDLERESVASFEAKLEVMRVALAELDGEE